LGAAHLSGRRKTPAALFGRQKRKRAARSDAPAQGDFLVTQTGFPELDLALAKYGPPGFVNTLIGSGTLAPGAK